MKVKSNFFSKSAKFAFALMTVCGALFTSCYEKDELTPVEPPTPPVADAVYYVQGKVTDFATGEVVSADGITLSGTESIQSGTQFSFKLSAPGSYTLTATKEGYEIGTTTVNVVEIPAGQISYLNADVAMKAIVIPVPEDIEATYTIQGTIQNKENDAPVQAGKIIIGGNEVPFSNGIYPKTDITSGIHTVSIEAEGYDAYTAIININKEMFAEATRIDHVFDFKLNKTPAVEPQPEAKKYPVYASSNLDGVTYTITGQQIDGKDVNIVKTAKVLNESLEAGSYTISANAGTDYEVQSCAFVLSAGSNEGFSWVVTFEKEAQVYEVTTYLDVIVLDNATGEDITDKVSIKVNNNDKGASGFATIAGANIIKVTDAADVYYGTTQSIEIEKETSDVEGKTKTIVATIKLNKKPVVTPQPKVYTVKAVAGDASVLFTLYNSANKIVDTNAGKLEVELKEKGTYSIIADKAGKVIDPVTFELTDDAPNFIWNVTSQDIKDINPTPGGGQGVVTPDKNVEFKLANNDKSPADVNDLPEVLITLPAGALPEPTTVSITIIPVENEADKKSNTATVLTFEGTPDGLVFDKPLEIQFADDFKLGNMNLYYLNETTNTWNKEGDPVASDGTNYIAKIPHFSKFKFGFESAFAQAFDEEKVASLPFNISNDTDFEVKKTVNCTRKGGMVMLTDIDAVVSTLLPEATDLAKNLIKSTVEALIYAQTSNKVSAEFAQLTDNVEVTIPATNILSSVKSTQTFDVATYTLTINEKALDVKVSIAGAAVYEPVFTPIDHGHGHGHGNGNNAGGGIGGAE